MYSILLIVLYSVLLIVLYSILLIVLYSILLISHNNYNNYNNNNNNNNNNNTKTNKMKMEFRRELEHPEECIKEDNPTRPTKIEVYFVSIYEHIL